MEGQGTMKFINLAVGLAVAIIGLIVVANILAGVYPSLVTSLTTLNNTAGIPLRTLIAPNGIIPLVVVAVFIIAIIVGLFAMIKGQSKR